jgi:hypothetical protein
LESENREAVSEAALVKPLAELLENFPQIVRVIFDDPQTFL